MPFYRITFPLWYPGSNFHLHIVSGQALYFFLEYVRYFTLIVILLGEAVLYYRKADRGTAYRFQVSQLRSLFV